MIMRILLRSVIAGFQRLVKSAVGPYLSDMGLPAIRSSFHLPSPQSSVFMVGFEIAVWMGMALACGFIERYCPGPPLIKGLIYAALIWLINAGIVSRRSVKDLQEEEPALWGLRASRRLMPASLSSSPF
ncbi:hypothetical protein [Rhizobium ruizarguesonis]|uniref:Uncharacterized protein n=1 Tax=Rhizobium ruizarguesonis TaxID=2081791 RepID=A0AB38I242_9HYPH|nr:hypothetical protein [Rhizobium ruizarguesonis]NKK61719.1 hypothetical protein [Rhizobium leguminosarum bv. viciae]TBC14907.1 hypothetical protein ELH40_08150 [Rhizobium ruizarguesonis]